LEVILSKSLKNPHFKAIPTSLSIEEFNEFILPHLSEGERGPKTKIALHKIFSYILTVLYTGMQWHMLSIDNDQHGNPEIHYSRVFRKFNQWANDGSFDKIFENSVLKLAQNNLIDLSVLHGDGSSHAAKKGGDNLGYSGHKHFKGEKVVAIVDRNVNIITPFTMAPGNKHESPLFSNAFNHLKNITNKIKISIKGCIMSLDSAYDSFKNRKMIFNAGMTPNVKENPRNRKNTKRGRKRIFDESIYQERFRTVERAFAWEDKFKRLLLRFEFKSINHLGMKLLGYTLINLRVRREILVLFICSEM